MSDGHASTTPRLAEADRRSQVLAREALVQAAFQASKYIEAFNLEDGSYLLANLLWRTYAQLTAKEYADWSNWDGDTVLLRDDLFDKLRKEKMLISRSLDEMKYMDAVYTARRFSSEVLGLTIAPTIDCNFACPYCYENKRPGRITAEVQEQLIDYVDRYLPGRKLLNIIWYGGEPLMCKEAVFHLSRRFVELADKNKCAHKFKMVTNGYLLTPEVADQLSEIGGWRNIQITLDGSAETHNVKRPLRSGKPTFDRVYANLRYASKRLPISLRMNVDLLNVEGCHDLIDRLADDGADLHVYFAPIHSFGQGCRDIEDKPEVKLSTMSAFSEAQSALVRHAIERGLSTALPFETSHMPQCQATSTHSVVVEPDGSLQRCWIEVGEDDKRVGHISEFVDLSTPMSARWLKFHPVRNDPCRSCEVLPLCFGSCPQRHLDGAPEELICTSIRYNLKEMVLAEYLGKETQLSRAKVGCGSCSAKAPAPAPA